MGWSVSGAGCSHPVSAPNQLMRREEPLPCTEGFRTRPRFASGG